MKRKIFTLLLTFIMVCGFSMSALAGSKAENIQTSGGSKGRITITFRCTCAQTSIPTTFGWTSSITSSYQGGLYSQNGKILLSNGTQKSFFAAKSSYSYETTDALQGDGLI